MQTSASWTRENTKGNNYLYNAANELNQNTQWYETFFRGYDPALGRFLQVDPLSFSEQATYQYAGNNPVMFNDPLGSKAQGPWALKAERMAMMGSLAGWMDWMSDPGGGGFHSPSGGNSTNWADGITQADWTLWGGSDTYREAMADGAMDLGGFLYFYDDKTSGLNKVVVQNGRIGYLKEENSVRRIEEEINGVTYTGVEVTSRLVVMMKAAPQERLSMAEAAAEIQKGGTDRFLEFINDPRYGPGFFLDDIEKTVTRNSDNLVLQLWRPAEPIGWAFKAASWGHSNFPNPNYDELRHIISSFLAAEKWGPDAASKLTMSNEVLGLWLDIRTPGPGTAFEWRDVLNNLQGISLWKNNNIK